MSHIKHVLWVNDHAAPVGGCERYIFETVGLLKKQGIQSSLLYQIDGKLDAAYLKQFDAAYPCVNPQLQIAEINPDIIYIHTLASTALTYEFARQPVPTVRFIHDHRLFCLREHKYTALGLRTCTKPIGAHCYPCLGFINRTDDWPGIKITTVSMLEREQRANLQLDAFILGSSYMKEHIIAHGFPAEKSYAIPLYAFPKTPNPNIQREENTLLFIGQLNRAKGVDLLLDALAASSYPAKLILAGDGRQEDMFRKQCEQLQLNDRVTFTGRLASDQIDELLQKATCLVFPSRSPETFGLVGVEAMRFGTPVIASNVGGIPDWLDDGVTGIAVPSGNAQALGQAIDQLLGDTALQHRMQENAVKHYQQYFQPEAHISHLLNCFQSIVERHHA